MEEERDSDGQPPVFFNQNSRLARDIDELLGFVKGVLLDGVVCEVEASALKEWVEDHPEVMDHPVGSKLFGEIDKIFEDGVADEEERVHLAQFLGTLIGKSDDSSPQGKSTTSELPLDDPAPQITVSGKKFVFTGKFKTTRKLCIGLTEEHDGCSQKNVTRETDYLVVGPLGSRDWKHTSFGNKIMKAMEYRDRGFSIAIVSENHWAEALGLGG